MRVSRCCWPTNLWSFFLRMTSLHSIKKWSRDTDRLYNHEQWDLVDRRLTQDNKLSQSSSVQPSSCPCYRLVIVVLIHTTIGRPNPTNDELLRERDIAMWSGIRMVPLSSKSSPALNANVCLNGTRGECVVHNKTPLDARTLLYRIRCSHDPAGEKPRHMALRHLPADCYEGQYRSWQTISLRMKQYTQNGRALFNYNASALYYFHITRTVFCRRTTRVGSVTPSRSI